MSILSRIRTRLRLLIAATCLAALSGGAPHPSLCAAAGRAAAPRPHLLLIGLDGADWQVIDPLLSRGDLPNLAGLIRSGVRSPLRTITPALSPVVWTSIATGVGPEKHGIWDFLAVEPGATRPSPVRSDMRRAPALWGILDAAGIKTGVVGWWATFPAESTAGFIVSDRVAASLFDSPARENALRPGAVRPASLADQVAAWVRSPAEIPDPEVRRYLRLEVAAGPLPEAARHRVEQLRTLLASSDSHAAIAAHLARSERPEFLAVYLEGTDTVAHLFMPYAPPRRDDVNADEALWFGATVTEYYRHADQLVGALLKAAGPDADVLVCSDHGFKTGAARPFTDSRIETGRAADWHRKDGILIMSGPSFQRGHRLEAASVLDIAPTVLRLFGYQPPVDFEGRVLEEAFAPTFLPAHPPQPIPDTSQASLQRGASRSRASSAGGPVEGLDSAAERDLLEKLDALGYLQRAPRRGEAGTANARNNRGLALLERGSVEEAIQEFRRAARDGESWFAYMNLARALLVARQPAEAEAILRDALEARRDDPEAHVLLGELLAERGDNASARRHLSEALRAAPNSLEALLALGRLEERAGNLAAAVARFVAATRASPEDPEAWNDLGRLELTRGKVSEAAQLFRRALEGEPRHAAARANLAMIHEAEGDLAAAEREYLRALASAPRDAAIRSNYAALLTSRRRWREAREALEEAVRLDPRCAQAWNNLGAVLTATGHPDSALAMYRRALELDPSYQDARRNLASARSPRPPSTLSQPLVGPAFAGRRLP